MAEKRRGRPAKLGDHHPYLLRMPTVLHAAVRRHARIHKVSMNDLLVAVISDWCSGKMQAVPADAAEANAPQGSSVGPSPAAHPGHPVAG